MLSRSTFIRRLGIVFTLCSQSIIGLSQERAYDLYISDVEVRCNHAQLYGELDFYLTDDGSGLNYFQQAYSPGGTIFSEVTSIFTLEFELGPTLEDTETGGLCVGDNFRYGVDFFDLACNTYSQIINTDGGYEIRMDIELLPRDFIPGPVTSTTIKAAYCDSTMIAKVDGSFLKKRDGIPFKISDNYNYSVFTWKYSIGNESNFQLFASNPLAGLTTTVYPQNVFGSDVAANYGVPFYIQVTHENCTEPSSGPYYFYPLPPVVKNVTTTDFSCHGAGNGAVMINGISRSLMTGESVSYYLFDREPVVVEESGNYYFKDPDNTSINLESVDIISGTTSTTGIGFTNIEMDASETSHDFYIYVVPSIGPNVTGCSVPENYSFTLNQPSKITTSGIVKTNPVCTNGNVTFSISIAAGVTPLTYLLNGASVNRTSGTQRNPSFSLPFATYGSGFTFQVRDTNGCTSDVVNVGAFINPSPVTVSGGITKDVLCNGDLAVLNVSASPAGTYTYEIDGGAYSATMSGPSTGVNFTNVPAGSYSVTATNSSGCISGNSLTINTDMPTQVILSTISVTPPSCPGGSDGRLEVVASGGTGDDFTYSMDEGPIQSSGIFTGTPGTYNIVVEDGAGCVSDILEVVIPEQTNSITFSAIETDLTCFEANDGQIEVTNVQNFTGDLFYSLDDSFYQTSPLFTGLAAGVYTVYVQDGNCTVSESPINVSQPIELTSTIQSISPSCTGGSDGSLVVTPSGGTAPYSYLWTHDGGTANTATAVAGDYEVTITDDNDCSIVVFGTILDPSEVFAEYSKSEINCNNANDGSITIFNVSGGAGNYRYEWSDNALITTQNRTNLAGGIYTVTVFDQNDCQYLIENIEIINPALLTLNVSSFEDVDCKGTSTGAITLNGSGGTGNLEYRIASSSWQPSSTFTGLTAGDYTLEVRDENGCTATVSQTIAEPDEILSLNFAISNATCETDGEIIANALGGTSPYTYQWADFPSETSNIVTVPAGLYDLTVTDQNGCTISLAANVSSDNGAEVVELNKKQPDCSNTSNGEVTLQLSGIPPFIIDWDHDESSSETASNLSVGDNWVSIFDGNLCEVRHNVQFTGPLPITASKQSETLPTCSGDADGTITIEVTGGNGGYTINWANGQTEPTSTGLVAGTHDVTITDGKGCTLSTMFTLAEKEVLGLSVNTQSPSCAEEIDGSITVTPQGGNGGYQYAWSHGPTTPTVNNLAAGTYTVILTDMEGCSHEQDIILQDPEPTSLILNDVTICSGQVYTVTSPTEGQDYQWTGPSGFDFTSKSVSVSETGSYNLMITDLKGCPVEASFEVVIDDELLNADFLVASEAFVGDTLVIIDISWPIPDAVEWALAEEARIISTNSEYTEVVFDAAGTYALGMSCTLAGCSASYSQAVTIKERTTATEESFAFSAPKEPMISKLSAFPNPTSGRFSLEVKLKEVGEATIRLIDASGNTVPYQRQLQGADNYTIEIDGSSLIAGMYFIQAQAGAEQKTFRMMVR